MAITKAPFETFLGYELRARSDSPFNDTFLAECREAALRYDKEDHYLRGPLLNELRRAIPFHFRENVFDGISFMVGG